MSDCPTDTDPGDPPPPPMPLLPPALAADGNVQNMHLGHGLEAVRTSLAKSLLTKDKVIIPAPKETELDLVRLETERQKTDDGADGKAAHLARAPSPSPPPPRQPLGLMDLPSEIVLEIIRHLDFGDMEHLRRTCSAVRYFASPHAIRVLIGPRHLKMQMLDHCKVCLAKDVATRSGMLLGARTDLSYPLASVCIPCAIKTNDDRVRVGKMVRLANHSDVWVCRWCGLPVSDGAMPNNSEFHARCYGSYNDAILAWFFLGVLQLCLCIIAAALAWRYFRHVTEVFAPTLVGCPLPAPLCVTWTCEMHWRPGSLADWLTGRVTD